MKLVGGGQRLAIYSLMSAERIGAIAERLADADSIRSIVRTGLDRGWDAIAGHPDDAAIARVLSDLDDILDGKLVGERYSAYLDDAIAATAYALEVVQGGDEKAKYVLGRCSEVAYRLADDIWPSLSLSELTLTLVYQDEIMRQVRDAVRISQWHDAVTPEKLMELRRESHKEGVALAATIAGEWGAAENVTPVVQPSLF